MALQGTEPESYITEHTWEYEDKFSLQDGTPRRPPASATAPQFSTVTFVY